MNRFSFVTAGDVDDAVETLTQNRAAKVIGGGTNLLDLMKENVERPDELVDVNHTGMDRIEKLDNSGLRLGASVTNADTAYHPLVEKHYPLLSKAILAGASAQLRNAATDGGNLMQRTRCYYFYDVTTPCNKRTPGSGCGAINGYNRIHAILGWSEQCIATHPSDMCVALRALDAVVNVKGTKGERQIPIADFHRLPGDTPWLDNNLQPDEIITSIDLPANGFNKNYVYLKLRDRLSYAFALVSVAAALDMEGSLVKQARLALGGVAHKPWRVEEAESLLVGKKGSEEVYRNVADKILQGAKGFAHNNFKIDLAKRAIVRALTEAAKMQ